jgi:hypothetical protein
LAALITGNLMGGLGNLLLLGVGVMLYFQFTLKPVKTPFELWQDKPRPRTRR